MTWLIITAFPEYGKTAIESATKFVDAPLDLRAAAWRCSPAARSR